MWDWKLGGGEREMYDTATKISNNEYYVSTATVYPLAISVFKEGIECVYIQEFGLGV